MLVLIVYSCLFSIRLAVLLKVESRAQSLVYFRVLSYFIINAATRLSVVTVVNKTLYNSDVQPRL